MTRFTIWAYRYFSRHRAVCWTIALTTAALFSWLSLKITFEEDITTLLPPLENAHGSANLAFSDLKVKDMVFILFHDRDGKVEPDTLAAVCDGFMQALQDRDTVNHTIHSVFYRMEDDWLENGITFLYDNLPIYLDSTAYPRLDSLLAPQSIERQMTANRDILLSATGGQMEDIVTHDPIGMRTLFMNGFNLGSGLGGRYTVIDQHIASADSSLLIAFIAPNFRSFNSKQGLFLAKLIEDQIKTVKQSHPEVEIQFHGAPIRAMYNSRRIKADLAITVTISLVIISILLLLVFRNKSTLLYLLTPVAYGTIFSMAMIYLIKGSMSLMAIGIGAIIMGVAFSYVLHIITHHKYVDDPIRLLKDQTVPVILGALTTIGAFASMMLTKSALLQDFGLFASLGLVGTTAFSLLFLPQMFSMTVSRKSERTFALLERINSFPFEKQKWLIVVIVAVSVVCFFKSDLKHSFDSNLQNIGYHDPKVVASERLLSQKTMASDTLYTIYMAAVSSDLDSALIGARHLCTTLDEAVATHRIAGYSPAFRIFVPTGEQTRRIKRWDNYWTPARRAALRHNVEAAAVAHGFEADAFDPFFEMLDTPHGTSSLYDADILPKGLMANIIEKSGDKYVVFIPVRMNYMHLLDVGNFVTARDPETLILDPLFYADTMVKMIRDDFNIILAISSLFVMLVLLVSFRNVLLAMLAFLPMGLSWYIVLGAMSIFGLKFNLINIIVSSFIFGIGVDYSIFIMDGLLSRFRTRDSLLMFHKTAIFFSAVILIIAVSSLLFAVHPSISSIGISTLIGMGATIVIAYSLQPFLFALLISDRAERGRVPVAVENLLWLRLPKHIRALRQNYLYKGVETKLRRELRATRNYALLGKYVEASKGAVLDYGSGYGYCSYLASLMRPDLQVVGFERDAEKRTLADNCFRKGNNISFTDDEALLKANYYTVILEEMPDLSLRAMLARGIFIAVRKAIADDFNKQFNAGEQTPLFKPCHDDGVFVVFIVRTYPPYKELEVEN